MKFKIGDRVIAQCGAPYSITTNGWRGHVVEINKYNDENIFVKKRNGEGYWVNANYFDLLDEKEGESEMDVSIRTCGGIQRAKSSSACRMSNVPVPSSKILCVRSSRPCPSFTFSPLYANAP